MEKIIHSQHLYQHTAVINMTEAIKKGIGVFKYNTRQKQITLTLSCEDKLFVKIEPSALDRIIYNLLDNAVKYTDKGGEIHVSLVSRASSVILKVKDTGRGIPKEEIHHIFKPYYRSKKETKEKGFGIGLFLIKYILDSIGGTVQVKSTVGEGSIFTANFPQYFPSEEDTVTSFIPGEPVKLEKVTFNEQTYSKDKNTILIVEDDMQLLSFLYNAFYPDYNVFYATNGQEALDTLLNTPKPDIVISDITMDVMDGHEFYHKLNKKAEYNDIPFIFLTGITGREEKLESLGKGVIDYIHKPFDMEEVKVKVKSILENRDKTKEKEVKKLEDRVYSILIKPEVDSFFIFESKCIEYKLSPREKEVLRYILEGLQLKEIADKLGVSIYTIRNHSRSIYKKCEVQNRVELMNLFKG